jgi:hypothetical protein
MSIAQKKKRQQIMILIHCCFRHMSLAISISEASFTRRIYICLGQNTLAQSIRQLALKLNVYNPENSHLCKDEFDMNGKSVLHLLQLPGT